MLRRSTVVFKCFYLGKVRYVNALKFQETLVQYLTGVCDHKPVLLLLQHFPVYTVGLRSSTYSKSDENYLSNLGADFVQTNRGGLITFHGTGQLVAYPILNLKSMGIGVRKYVENLEEVIIQLCAMYNIKAQRSPHTGVWVGNDKVCAMGINVQRGITSHGLALNCNTDLSWFSHIVPCGIHGKGVTSLSELTKRNVTVKEILSPFSSIFSKTFNVDLEETIFLNEDLSDKERLQELVGHDNKSKFYHGTMIDQQNKN